MCIHLVSQKKNGGYFDPLKNCDDIMGNLLSQHFQVSVSSPVK